MRTGSFSSLFSRIHRFPFAGNPTHPMIATEK